MRRTLPLLLLVACSKESKDVPKAEAPAVSDAAAAVADAAYAPSGDKPANARRPEPLSDMLGGAVAVGAKAPAIDLPTVGGGHFRLGDALTKTERVVLVFYRGDW